MKASLPYLQWRTPDYSLCAHTAFYNITWAQIIKFRIYFYIFTFQNRPYICQLENVLTILYSIEKKMSQKQYCQYTQ